MQALNQLSQHLEDRLAGLVNLFHQEVQPVLQPEKDVEMVSRLLVNNVISVQTMENLNQTVLLAVKM